uniref:Sterile alpha motif domain-containing protein 3 n=1 Tax=Larimichthys crocea TaxID=215358 RepID=A0A0F8AMZ6_LARCR
MERLVSSAGNAQTDTAEQGHFTGPELMPGKGSGRNRRVPTCPQASLVSTPQTRECKQPSAWSTGVCQLIVRRQGRHGAGGPKRQINATVLYGPILLLQEIEEKTQKEKEAPPPESQEKGQDEEKRQHGKQRDDSSSLSSGCSFDTDILSSPESTSSRSSAWPVVFQVPRFSYDTELQLDRANATGTLLNPDTKLKSAILNGLAETIIQYKMYLSDSEFENVAEALILKHPCLKEPGSISGYGGWKASLKYKLDNYTQKNHPGHVLD